MEHIITEEVLQKYSEYLGMEEKSNATIKKYICDIKKLMVYAGGQGITKELMLGYKEYLRVNKKYKLSSINSFLIAANRFFEYMQWYGINVKTYRIQNGTFTPGKMDLSMQEYKKLVAAARRKGKKRLVMVIQTLCAMGLRISELSYVTVEGVKKGEIDIYGKTKQRRALVPGKLKKLLSLYIKENNIKSGKIFITSRGNAVDRSNIWREMKTLKEETDVAAEKIFPHNLRHLFAKTFYEASKDIAKLADVLGHSSIETTRIYIKTTSKEHRKLLDKMKIV